MYRPRDAGRQSGGSGVGGVGETVFRYASRIIMTVGAVQSRHGLSNVLYIVHRVSTGHSFRPILKEPIMTNIVNQATVSAAIAYFKSTDTMIEKRSALGKAFIADGFQIATDFTSKSAKDAGREDRFRAVQYLAQESMPANVAAALRDSDISGKKMIKADGVNQTKTDWSKRVPAKVRNLQEAFKLFLATDAEKKGAKANTPRDINTRIKDEIAKLVNAVKNDADVNKTKEPVATFDHAEMLTAFTRALGLIGK